MDNAFNLTSGLASIFGTILTGFTFYKAMKIENELQQEKQRKMKKVSVVLQCENNSFQLPGSILRVDLTRAEVLGHLGMIPMKSPKERFSIGYLNGSHFFSQIHEISAGKEDAVLKISCNKEEWSQFNEEKIQDWCQNSATAK
ncbi:MAG: hypothetical protein PHI97_21085 [Desulfobulbus sp.]|nr:hypothetical protein [Desulfobulbus sp.]